MLGYIPYCTALRCKHKGLIYMSNPIERSLNDMADVSKTIMENAVARGELTQADIIFLTMYQKEKARATAVPLYKKIIGGVTEIAGVIKQLMPSDTDESTEVDTDAI